ncbi:MAG: GTPase [Christensenellales bacterium]
MQPNQFPLQHNKKLAKTSSNPGKTRLINFFKINREFYFVDLPGYGFARAPKTEKDKWGKLMEDYLSSGRVDHIFMLIIYATLLLRTTS